MRKIIINLRIYCLAIKYWAQGDEWDFAVEYAKSLVKWTE